MFIKRERYDTLLQAMCITSQLKAELARSQARISDLQTEVQLLKDRTDREQQRADSALQTMVAHQTGVAVPMPQVAPSNEDVDPHAEDPIVVEELRERVRKGNPLKVLLEEHEATS